MPHLNEPVKSIEIAIFMVPLHPGRGVVNCDIRRQGHCLAKVNHVHTAESTAIVDKEQGAADQLPEEERAKRRRKVIP